MQRTLLRLSTPRPPRTKALQSRPSVEVNASRPRNFAQMTDAAGFDSRTTAANVSVTFSFPLVFLLLLLRLRLFTPWADLDERLLWTPQGERPARQWTIKHGDHFFYIYMTSVNRMTSPGAACATADSHTLSSSANAARGSSVSNTMSSTAPGTALMTTVLLVLSGPAASSSSSWPLPSSSSLPVDCCLPYHAPNRLCHLPQCLPRNIGPDVQTVLRTENFHFILYLQPN
jgi:hypothetical protein